MSRAAVSVFGAIVLLVIGSNALVFQETQSVRGATDGTAVNDSWTPTEGQTTTLAHSNINDAVYDREDDVVVKQNNTTYEPAGNWEWNDRTGEITAVNGTSLNTSATAYAEYAYYTQQNTHTILGNISAVLVNSGSSLMVLLVFALIVGVLAVFRGAM